MLHLHFPDKESRFRVCVRCGVKKALNHFGKDKSKATGRRGTCRQCRKPHERDAERRWREKNSDDDDADM